MQTSVSIQRRTSLPTYARRALDLRLTRPGLLLHSPECASSQIGVFSRLTNSYCLVALQGSENFYSAFESELARDIPVRALSANKYGIFSSYLRLFLYCLNLSKVAKVSFSEIVYALVSKSTFFADSICYVALLQVAAKRLRAAQRPFFGAAL